MSKPANFVLLGAAGYIAPKHLKAIKSVNGNLLAALDPHDSVGILDSYFPDCSFFTEFERFDRHCSKIADDIDYVSICSPNHLHDAHCRFAMRLGADAICEKPLVLQEKNLDALQELEAATSRKIHTILQLRYNPILIRLKKLFEAGEVTADTAFLRYYTPRGIWYHHSWKTNMEKSGGLMTNIGIHLVDALCWIFGKCQSVTISRNSSDSVAGCLEFKKIEIYFTLSISQAYQTLRVLEIGPDSYELSGNFRDLHGESYSQILAGESFGIEDVRESVRICEIARKGCWR